MALNPDLFTALYKPDVLMCLADLSNDEVFTPPDIANQVLDMLPQELFRDPNTKFLDPALKSGVFLREIAKRLIAGLADKIPNLQDRCDHIFKTQLYGIAITELTSLLGRRSVYCSKYPNSPFSITKFDSVQGNIRFHKIRHRWDHTGANGKCVFCGTAYDGNLGDINREGLETHAYEFIHTIHPEEIFDMKFDVIISNPPYQLSDGGQAASAKSIYQLFVEQAKKLNPRYISMIIPARWYTNGKGQGMKEFRKAMLTDNRISHLVDFKNSADCFPGVNIAGGICYFLWERDYNGACEITNRSSKDDSKVAEIRRLNEFNVLVRDNVAVGIIRKIRALSEKMLSESVKSYSYFAVRSYERGEEKKNKPSDVVLLSSKGKGYYPKDKVVDKEGIIGMYKVIITYAMSGGNKPSSDGTYQVISSLMVLEPNEVCTETYLILGVFNNKKEAQNMMSYVSTKLFRFLLLQALTSIHITKESFLFVPALDYKTVWTDDELYRRFNLAPEEVTFIETLIRPMDTLGGE